MNEDSQNNRQLIKSLKAYADQKRTFSEKVADWMTITFGSIPFLIVNTLWFAVWITINTNVIPGVIPFDPFPFGLLTMIVSLEAIVLAIFVLISQNRSERVEDLREEIDLHIDITTEKEVTKLIGMVNLLMQKNGIDTSEDKVMASMLQPTNLEKIRKVLEGQVTES